MVCLHWPHATIRHSPKSAVIPAPPMVKADAPATAQARIPYKGITAVELGAAIEGVHFAIAGQPEVERNHTTFDAMTRTIEATVVLKEDVAPASALEDILQIALSKIVEATGPGVDIGAKIIQTFGIFDSTDSNGEHMVGEELGVGN